VSRFPSLKFKKPGIDAGRSCAAQSKRQLEGEHVINVATLVIAGIQGRQAEGFLNEFQD
jgi:hypothetical protein